MYCNTGIGFGTLLTTRGTKQADDPTKKAGGRLVESVQLDTYNFRDLTLGFSVEF